MPTAPRNRRGMRLDAFVEAFEAALARGEEADLARFLPPPGQPLYGPVLRELVRVDLEYHWDRGRPRRLEEYQRLFPELAADPEGLRHIAFEEYRLRWQAGENPSPGEYQARLGVATDDWPLLSEAASRRAPAHGAAASPSGRRPPKRRPAASPSPGGITLRVDLEEVARAYREFHLHHPDGDPAAVAHWRASFQGPQAEHAGLFHDLHLADPHGAYGLARGLTSFPEVGDQFLGFHLLAQLGRGAFGKVFLAEEAELADRLVALKLSTDLVAESHRLAQLQHTHIVPVYSVHRGGPLQALCMPYLGATTLADVVDDLSQRQLPPVSGKELVSTVRTRQSITRRGLDSGEDTVGQALVAGTLRVPGFGTRSVPATTTCPTEADGVALKKLEGLSYTQAVLWIGAGLADGLGHAHDRGILHRDLKPANILLTDDGQPMLLDFNLSEDTKLRGTATAASVGGTLPYMAPEQLQAFVGAGGVADARSDVYALGVILYELLTGRHPFPRPEGPLTENLPKLLDQRRQPPPRLRPGPRTITPAVEAIVRHCLEPDPARRYQSAHELHEDLRRQLDDRPLRYAGEPSLHERAHKWRRRHPRLTSSGSVAVLAVVLLAGLGALLLAHGRRLARLEALDTLAHFRDDLKATQFHLNAYVDDRGRLEEGMTRCREALERYRVLEDPAWSARPAVQRLPAAERERLRADVGELLLLFARATALPGRAPAGGDDAARAALRLTERAEACYAPGQAPRALWLQRAELAEGLGETAEAQRLRARAQATPLRGARDRYLAAGALAVRGDFRAALPLLRDATRQDPQDFWAHFLLGVCHFGLSQDAEAAASYTTCIALWPAAHWAYFNRGVIALRQQEFASAEADFDQVLRLQPDLADAYVNRALARQGLRRHGAAVDDLTRALEHGTAHTRVYFMRARARDLLGDADGARRDRAEGFRRPPNDETGWIARGVARLSDDPGAALADFTQALAFNPRSRAALQNQAHVLAERLGRLDEAAAVLDRAVALYPDFVPARAGRGVVRARLEQWAAARQDAEEALARDRRPPTLYQVAGIYALTSRQDPQDRERAFRLLSAALQQGYGLALLESDREWDALREDPAFRRLVEAARALSTTR